MRQPEHAPGRLPREWLNAITEAARDPIRQSYPRKRASRSRDDPLDSYDHVSELRCLISELKQERLRRGLSLGDIAKHTQQARSAISRLENGEYTNPTLHTVYRYARALGWHIRLCTEPVEDDYPPDVAVREPHRK